MLTMAVDDPRISGAALVKRCRARAMQVEERLLGLPGQDEAPVVRRWRVAMATICLGKVQKAECRPLQEV
jgi:hypothetical protein